MTSITNRETWLNQLAGMMAPRFAELGHPLPAFRVSVGFTSGGMNSRANGECWNKSTSGDDHYSIFISPAEGDSITFAAILFHELAHAAVGLQAGHKGPFAAVMAGAGMVRPFTSSIPGDAFREWVAPFLEQLGEIPHSALRTRPAPGARPMVKRGPAGVDAPQPREDGDSADQGDGGDSSRPKPQTGRLRKACCSECGYTVRVTAKWVEVGPPHCPNHGAMTVEA